MNISMNRDARLSIKISVESQNLLVIHYTLQCRRKQLRQGLRAKGPKNQG